MEKPKRKFQPKSVSRRSKEERDSTAPAIKQEPQEPKPRPQQEGPRRRRGIKGEYLDEAQGPLSAPALADPRAKPRVGGFTAPTSGGGGSGGRGQHHQVNPGSSAQGSSTGGRGNAPPAGDWVNIATDNGFYAPQIVSKEAITRNLQPTLLSNKLYLFNLPPLGGDDSMDLTTNAPIGKLRTHASGKMTMLIDGVIYDVSSGIPTKTVQDVMLIENDTAYKLGSIKERMVIVPASD